MPKPRQFVTGGVDDFLTWNEGNSLVHIRVCLDLERLRERAAKTLAEIEAANDEDSKLARIMAAMGASYFQGAQAEAIQLDEAVTQISLDRQEMAERSEWDWCLPSVIGAALVFIRESWRDDGAHRARLSKREHRLHDIILNFAKERDKRR